MSRSLGERSSTNPRGRISGSYKNTDATNAVMLHPRSIGPRHRRAAKEAEEISASHGSYPEVRGALTVRGGSLVIKEFGGTGRGPLCGPRRVEGGSLPLPVCSTAQSRRSGSLPLLSSAARF